MSRPANGFLRLALQNSVLRFGSFTLKSGRVSPYFFNAGRFQDGKSLAQLGQFYAEAIVAAGLEFDMLFGPAYKGIPLVASIAIAFDARHDRNVPWAFNRKEAKDHGEGGQLVGAPLQGRVLIVDDVISAGTSIRESTTIISQQGASAAGVAIGLDRKERGNGEISAVQEVESELGLRVISVANLNDLAEFISNDPELAQYLSAIEQYRQTYGV